MALNTQLADATVNAQANSLAALCNNGYIRIMDGTQPASADVAVSTQVKLAELRFGATAFGAAVSGLITANAITADSAADATGTATWFRVVASDGTTTIFDGSVGTSAANMVLPTVSIAANQTVSCSSFSHDVRNSSTGL